MLAAQEPLWPLGTGYAYHALTHGWVAGEIIRRVTGESVGTYFRDLITQPLGVDAWIGLPDAHGRSPGPSAGQRAAFRTLGRRSRESRRRTGPTRR